MADYDKTEVPSPDSDDKEFVTKVLERYRSCLSNTDDWRDEARTAFDYVAGHQWTDEERASMEEQSRAPVTFNRTEVFVQAVCGLEALNRNEVQFLPRQPGPEQTWQADLWNGAVQYVNDDCDAEVHHSTAFKDCVVCGMGWTETRMDYEVNPDGEVKVERIDPLQMFWDHTANQRNLADAKWLMRVKPMSISDVKALWPDKADDLEFSRVWEPEYEPESVHNASEAWKYEHDQSRRAPRSEDEEIYVAQYQWFERVTYYRVQINGKMVDLSREQWSAVNRMYQQRQELDPMMPVPKAVAMTKRQHKTAFMAGWTVLETADLESEDFTLQCVTGKLDRNNNVWYGLVRPLKDPQDWLNKLFSQILYILGTNAKGGLMAEKDAFDNVQRAEDDWSNPSRIVWLKSGALREGKVQERALAKYPEGQDRLMMFAMNMFQDVSGANLELLGLADRQQPGVLESQRKQAGMTILAWAFDSLRAYRKRQSRVLAQYIREYLSDGRLVRIVGQEGAQYVPLMKDALAFEYDIIVGESPQSPNERERTFQVLMALMPSLAQMGMAPPPSFIDYLPLPAKVSAEWKKAMSNPQQEQMKKQAFELETAQAQADLQKTAAETQETQTKAKLNEVKAATEMYR